MGWLAVVLALLFALFGLACLLLVVLGLPGTWILIAVAAGVELADGAFRAGPSPTTFGWGLILGCVALAGLGEGLEAVSGIAGTRLGGGGRRGMVGAFVGGLAGAIALTPLLPVPIVGTLVGALLGTFVGAWVGEATGPKRRRRGETLRAALGAVVGRLAGTLAKLATGSAVWVLLVRALLPR